MKEELILKISKLMDEYEYSSEIYANTSFCMSEYYKGKTEGLKDILWMLNEME